MAFLLCWESCIPLVSVLKDRCMRRTYLRSQLQLDYLLSSHLESVLRLHLVRQRYLRQHSPSLADLGCISYCSTIIYIEEGKSLSLTTPAPTPTGLSTVLAPAICCPPAPCTAVVSAPCRPDTNGVGLAMFSNGVEVEFGVAAWVVGTVGRTFSFSSSVLDVVLDSMFSLGAGASPDGRRGRTLVLSRTESVAVVEAEVEDGSANR